MRRGRWCILGFVSLLAASGATPSGDTEPARVAIVCGTARPSQEAAAAMRAALAERGMRTELLTLPSEREGQKAVLEAVIALKPDAIATGGTAATKLILEHGPPVPVVFFMVPNVADTPFVTNGKAQPRSTGVTSDIEPGEQITWVAAGAPQCRKLAILHSERSRETVRKLVEEANRTQLQAVAIAAHKDEFPQAIAALQTSGCDGVLMIPDAGVYNSANVQRLLLWGARQGKPVWTFSENIVRAGAFAGMYCDSADVGLQAAELVGLAAQKRILRDRRLHYPRHVGRAVNVHTAKLIGVNLDQPAFKDSVARLGDER